MFYHFNSKELEHTLVLDLDETLIALQGREHLVHLAHSFSDPFWATFDRNSMLYVDAQFHQDLLNPQIAYVINPEELKWMIMFAYQNNASIVILTTGLYDKAILKEIADMLKLPEREHAKFSKSNFFSPVTLLNLGIIKDVPFDNLRSLHKASMIRSIRKYYKLKHHRFLLLDNDFNNVNSCHTYDYIVAVMATTMNENKFFYQVVINLLRDFTLMKEAIKDVRQLEILAFLMSLQDKVPAVRSSHYLQAPCLFSQKTNSTAVQQDIQRSLKQ